MLQDKFEYEFRQVLKKIFRHVNTPYKKLQKPVPSGRNKILLNYSTLALQIVSVY